VAEPETKSSLLLRSARLPGIDEPVDILIADGRITEVSGGGMPTSASATAARRAEVGESVDLEGRWVIPGLWDEHVHFTQLALMSRRLDVSPAESAAETARIVGAAVVAEEFDAYSGPVVGYGFRDALWPDEPSVQLLDESARGASVVLVSADLHCVWLSSRAATDFGVDVDSSGLLREDEAFEVERALQMLPDVLVDSWAIAVGERAASRGVTGFVDLEMTWNRDTWIRRRAAGFASQRVRFGVYPADIDRAFAAEMRTGSRVDDLLEVGHLKVLIDGSLNTRTAFCVDPYPGGSDEYGWLTVQPEELEALLVKARAGGLVPTVHAIGDHAVRVALDVFERLGTGGRMEHAQLISDVDLPRFGALGVVASVQPAHLLDDREVADHHWAGRTGRAFPLRSLIDSGATLALGSDAPVAPLDPWVTIAAAVHRRDDEREPWHPEQTITVTEALAASAGGRTTVEAGDAADLAVLDADPWAASERELRELPVAATILDGRFTHRAL